MAYFVCRCKYCGRRIELNPAVSPYAVSIEWQRGFMAAFAQSHQHGPGEPVPEFFMSDEEPAE